MGRKMVVWDQESGLCLLLCVYVIWYENRLLDT